MLAGKGRRGAQRSCIKEEPAKRAGDTEQGLVPPRYPLFVIEADEYDTAFFDTRSKFVH